MKINMGPKAIIITSGIGAVMLMYLKHYLGRKQDIGDKLDTETKVTIEPVKLRSLSIKLRLDVMVKNPTEGTLTIRQPYVQVLFNGKQIAQSQLSNSEVEIPAYSPKALEPIFLTIPATGLFTLGDGLLKSLLKNQQIDITTVTRTSVKLGGVFMSQTKTDTTTLNKKSNV